MNKIFDYGRLIPTLYQNRMNAARFKDKDYLAVMKKMIGPHPETKQKID